MSPNHTVFENFAALHSREKAFVIPNPWDVGTSRILARMGFEALATTSAGLAFSLGKKDGQVTREEALDHCRLIVGATPLPVSADLEKGFGDSPESAAETITAAAETGIAGGSLEDFCGDAEAPIYPLGLAVERIQAASEAARALGRPFVFTARCENFLHGVRDLDDTIERLLAYEAAGADVLYAPGLIEISLIEKVCDAVSKPVNVVIGMPGATFSVSDLDHAGVRRISLGSAFARVAYGAFLKAARESFDDGTFGFVSQAANFKDIESFFD